MAKAEALARDLKYNPCLLSTYPITSQSPSVRLGCAVISVSYLRPCWGEKEIEQNALSDHLAIAPVPSFHYSLVALILNNLHSK